MKNSNNNIRNRTRDLPNYSAVPQPNAPPRAPSHLSWQLIFFFYDSLTSTFLSSAITQLSIFLSPSTVLLLILLLLFFTLFFQLFLLLSTQFFACFPPQNHTLIILPYPSRRLSLLSQIYKTFSVTPFQYTVFLIILPLLYFTYYLLVRLPSITLQIFLMSESDPATSTLESFMLRASRFYWTHVILRSAFISLDNTSGIDSK